MNRYHQPEPTEIRVVFESEKQKIVVSPDPAEVWVGNPIVWRFEAKSMQVRRIRWTVYFHRPRLLSTLAAPFHFWRWLLFRRRGIPFFPGVGTELSSTTQAAGAHEGTIGPATPESPGEYKYGVRVENAETGATLGDDDPILLVRR